MFFPWTSEKPQDADDVERVRVMSMQLSLFHLAAFEN